MLDPARLEELKNTGNLPSPRGVALEIIRLSQNEQVTAQQLSRAIQSDPALTGRILKAANSPVMGLRRPAVAIQDAVLLLGIPMIRQLTLGFSLVANYRQGACAAFDYEQYWQISLLHGISAQAIARQIHVGGAEELFVLGLLARVGRLAFATLYPQEYSEVLKDYAAQQTTIPEKLLQAEQSTFETNHLEMATALLQDWGLPRVLVLAVAVHEDPESSNLPPSSREYRIAACLNLADRLAQLIYSSKNKAIEQRRAETTKLLFEAARLGMDAENLLVLTEEINEHWQHWGQILDIPTFDVGKVLSVSSQGMSELEEPAANVSPEYTTQGHVNKGIRVLVVDDDVSVTLLLQKLLVEHGHSVAIARDGRQALEMTFKFRPEIVVTDWMMPQMDGLQLVRALRETKLGQAVYVLFLTSLEGEDNLVQAFDVGIDDFLVKPIMPRVLKARLRAAERFVQQRRELANDLEEIRRFATELAVNNRKLQQAVLTDPLTGLPNRRYAIERLEQELAAARRRNGPLSLIMLDVDFFKQINDQHGHDVGDEVLRHVASVLRAKARLQDAICRIGGEEFLVICPDTGRDEVGLCAERLRTMLQQQPFTRDKLKITVTASLGVATAIVGASSADLIKQADRGVYQAKAEGRNRVVAVPEAATT